MQQVVAVAGAGGVHVAVMYVGMIPDWQVGAIGRLALDFCSTKFFHLRFAAVREA
jgi:hypothetical protein